MIMMEKMLRLAKQEALEDRLPVLVFTLPVPLVWFVVAENPKPEGHKRFRDVDEIRADIEGGAPLRKRRRDPEPRPLRRDPPASRLRVPHL